MRRGAEVDCGSGVGADGGDVAGLRGFFSEGVFCLRRGKRGKVGFRAGAQ